MSFIKRFKDLFPQPVALIVVVIIALFMVINSYPGGNVWFILQSMLPVILVALAAVGLQYYHKTVAAHGVLLFYAFLGGLTNFINMILSFNFQTMSFTWPAGSVIETIVGLIIFLYLVLIILSYMMTGDLGAKYSSSPVWMSILIAFAFFLLRNGFNTALLKVVPAMIALLYAMPFFSVLLLLAGLIDIPFNIINFISIGIIGSRPLSYFIFALIGFYLIYLSVKALLEMKKRGIDKA